jgi:hypothetical protein
MEYVCALGRIAVAAVSPGRPGRYGGNRSTDKRQIRDQEAGDRELFHKEMEQPRARFAREPAKAAAARGQPESSIRDSKSSKT